MDSVGLAAHADAGAGVCFVILRGYEADMSRGRVAKHCEIVLTGPAVPAGRHVELAATSAANSMLFHMYVGGELQTKSRHVAIRSEPSAMW